MQNGSKNQTRNPYPYRMRLFQIIFNPTSAAELARMPKELQLQILGEFRGLPQQVMNTELDQFGKLERAGRILHRFRVGDYRVYFGLKLPEDEALQQNPKFWELIEAARGAAPKG